MTPVSNSNQTVQTACKAVTPPVVPTMMQLFFQPVSKESEENQHSQQTYTHSTSTHCKVQTHKGTGRHKMDGGEKKKGVFVLVFM